MKFGGGGNPVAGALDVTRLLESFGFPPWCGAFGAPGEISSLPGSDDDRQAGRTHPPRGASTRILLIDDQATDLDSLRLILVLEGYEVDCVQSGVEGLRRALSGDYGLVILTSAVWWSRVFPQSRRLIWDLRQAP